MKQSELSEEQRRPPRILPSGYASRSLGIRTYEGAAKQRRC